MTELVYLQKWVLFLQVDQDVDPGSCRIFEFTVVFESFAKHVGYPILRADPRGSAPGVRPPYGPKFSQFHAVFGKI